MGEAVRPGRPESSHSALWIPFIPLSAGSQWAAGKSGSRPDGQTTSLAHKGEGRWAASLAPRPRPGPWLGHLSRSPRWRPPRLAARGSRGRCPWHSGADLRAREPGRAAVAAASAAGGEAARRGGRAAGRGSRSRGAAEKANKRALCARRRLEGGAGRGARGAASWGPHLESRPGRAPAPPLRCLTGRACLPAEPGGHRGTRGDGRPARRGAPILPLPRCRWGDRVRGPGPTRGAASFAASPGRAGRAAGGPGALGR